MVQGSGKGDREADCQVAQATPQSIDEVILPDLICEIKESPGKGYGLFALADIPEGEFILENLGLEIPSDEVGETLDAYVFEYDDDNYILAMGGLSYLNHSNRANCEYEVYQLEDGRHVVQLHAWRDIKEGEELTINYNGHPDNPTPWNFGEEECETSQTIGVCTTTTAPDVGGDTTPAKAAVAA